MPVGECKRCESMQKPVVITAAVQCSVCYHAAPRTQHKVLKLEKLLGISAPATLPVEENSA